MDILKDKIIKLSLLSQETRGGSFVISHQKDTGLFKVTFPNHIFTKTKELEYTEIDRAIDEGIIWLKENRSEKQVAQHYSLITAYGIFKTNKS